MPPFGVFSNIFRGNNSITMRNGHMAENAGKPYFEAPTASDTGSSHGPNARAPR